MNRIEFLNILESVKPGLSKLDFTEQSDCFIFNKNYITTSNEQITIIRAFESGIEGVISADELYQFIKKLKSEDIEIAVINNQLMIKDKRTTASFNINKVKSNYINHSNLSKDWSGLPDNFSEALKICLFSASTNNLIPAYTCLNINKYNIISCDNFRITKTKLNKEINSTFLLPATIAKQLINYNPILYNIEDNWIHFLNKEDVLFSCIQSNYKYPNTESSFDIEGEKIKLPKKLNEVLERAQIFTKAEDKEDLKINLIIQNNTMICKANGIAGSIEETIRVRYRGPDIKIKINPLFLSQAINLDEVIIGDSSILFKGENTEHIIKLSE